MSGLEAGALVVFCASAGGIGLLFGLYPLAVLLAGSLRRAPAALRTPGTPSVSLLVALRNAEGLAEAKVRNSLALAVPGALQIVFVSDGSSDGTVERLRAAGGERIEVVELTEHRGKALALDVGAKRCTGEILVFSDGDALLAPDALLRLLEPFGDEAVGGVCGQRVIQEAERGADGGELTGAQGGYIVADSALKRAEARLGSVTANDGKLYALRRALYRPIAPGATDDLYSCLSVVEQGRRFVFEPRARAFIRTPSRSAPHELARRRRIVARSLHGIARKRALLDPRRHGFFAFQLLVNKVLRRLLPLLVVGLFLSSVALAFAYPLARVALAAQLLFYGLALARAPLAAVPGLGAAAGLAYYFCVGNLGTFLGLMDFLRGRETIKWDPIKSG